MRNVSLNHNIDIVLTTSSQMASNVFTNKFNMIDNFTKIDLDESDNEQM